MSKYCVPKIFGYLIVLVYMSYVATVLFFLQTTRLFFSTKQNMFSNKTWQIRNKGRFTVRFAFESVLTSSYHLTKLCKRFNHTSLSLRTINIVEYSKLFSRIPWTLLIPHDVLQYPRRRRVSLQWGVNPSSHQEFSFCSNFYTHNGDLGNQSTFRLLPTIQFSLGTILMKPFNIYFSPPAPWT